MVEIGIAILLCVILWIAYRAQSWKAPQSTQAGKSAQSAYETRPEIFVNSAEQLFFAALNRAKPDDYLVFSKVRLEDIFRVKTRIENPRQRWQYRGRIKSRHIDFVICDKYGKFICAVELDGPAHQDKQAEMVDGFKDDIFANAALPLHRVKTDANFGEFSRKLWAEITSD